MSRPSFSLKYFIEQTAKKLREAVKISSNPEHNYRKENGLSNRNKIHQIASLLRSKAKKQQKKRK